MRSTSDVAARRARQSLAAAGWLVRPRVVLLATVASMALAVPAMAVDASPGADPSPTAGPSADSSQASSPSPDPGTPGDSPTLADPATPTAPTPSGSGEGNSLPTPTGTSASATAGGAGQHPLLAAANSAAGDQITYADCPYDPRAPHGFDGPCNDWDPLPKIDLPYMLDHDPYYPQSIAGLKQSPEPTCPAPPLPAPTSADSAGGYTVPLRIKLTNGVILAGYTPMAAKLGQQVPFEDVVSGLTGWIIARVSLPSLKLSVEPSDVHLCDGGLLKAFQPSSSVSVVQWAAGIGAASLPFTQPDGTKYIPWPASLSSRLTGLDGMQFNDLVVDQLTASVAGVNPDGSLELQTTMASTGRSVPPPICTPDGCRPNSSFECNMHVSGTFGTAAKQRVVAQPPTVKNEDGGDYSPRVPPRQDETYLPTKPLTGAVRGGTATIGSNWFTAVVPSKEGNPNTQGSRCGFDIPITFYGFNLVDGFVDNNWTALVTPPDSGLPIAPGLADLSLDMTIDQVGLPRFADLPVGYGFE